MKSWLKFFGLSFFSDKIAKEARIRGVLNCVLGFVLSLLFIFCGVLAANTVPFYAHYNNAAQFKEFLYSAVEGLHVTVNDGLLSAESRINTFDSESDRAAFGVNGYNLVVDTRPSDALDDFIAYYEHKDDGLKISRDDYADKTEEEQKKYAFKLEYTKDEFVLTEELVAGYEEFLAGSGDENIKKEYGKLKENQELDGEELWRQIYALYLKAYYPEITSYVRSGEAPLLRNYYYVTYLYSSDVKNSLYIFDDVLFGYFNTKGGVAVNFFGNYSKSEDGTLSVEGADGFIKGAFKGSVATSASVYLTNVFRFIPFIALIPVLLAAVAAVTLTLLKDDKYKKYTTCLKIEFSFMLWSALFTALIMFICGFFVSSNVLNNLPLIIMAGVMVARTVILLVHEYLLIKKEKEYKKAAEFEERLAAQGYTEDDAGE